KRKTQHSGKFSRRKVPPSGTSGAAGRRSGGPGARLALAAQEHPVRRIGGFVHVRIAGSVEKTSEFDRRERGDLHSDQDAAVIGPVVAVVEERDVPPGAHAVEEA